MSKRGQKNLRAPKLRKEDEDDNLIPSKLANKIWLEGRRVLIIVPILFSMALLYYSLLTKQEYTVLDVNDFEQLKRVISSGEPWYVQCVSKASGTLPEGFSENLSELKKIVKVALLNCHEIIPRIGSSAIKRLSLNTKKNPIGFISAGGNQVQLDSKLISSGRVALVNHVQRNGMFTSY